MYAHWTSTSLSIYRSQNITMKQAVYARISVCFTSVRPYVQFTVAPLTRQVVPVLVSVPPTVFEVATESTAPVASERE
ncbi:MAG: hypothetical protein A3F41_02495 [Coxiella sp. RIFCSPHIGHO2_12_FULL_44_14]|nr:MAG: hypothetical protein A3F41_02495 [Coxiella sp. RIFCSPHIGHO2_12_FULL_44_14]